MNFDFQPEVCHGCLDLMQKAMSFNGVAIGFVKRNNYRIHFLIWLFDWKISNIIKNK